MAKTLTGPASKDAAKGKKFPMKKVGDQQLPNLTKFDMFSTDIPVRRVLYLGEKSSPRALSRR